MVRAVNPQASGNANAHDKFINKNFNDCAESAPASSDYHYSDSESGLTSSLQGLRVLELDDITGDTTGSSVQTQRALGHSLRSERTPEVSRASAAMTPARALREPVSMLRCGESVEIDVGDVIAFDFRDKDGGIPRGSVCQFVVDVQPANNRQLVPQVLCLRDATTRESLMHELVFEVGPLEGYPFTRSMGRKALYDAFLSGLNPTRPESKSAQIALLTSPRSTAIRRALQEIELSQCSFRRMNFGERASVFALSDERPILVEKGAFRSDIGLLTKKGDRADLQPGDTLSIRRLVEFKVELLNKQYWLSCTKAAPQCAGLRGQSFRLGSTDGTWAMRMGRDFFRTTTPLISSQQAVVKHSAARGLSLVLPKDQTTLWMGIRRT